MKAFKPSYQLPTTSMQPPSRPTQQQCIIPHNFNLYSAYDIKPPQKLNNCIFSTNCCFSIGLKITQAYSNLFEQYNYIFQWEVVLAKASIRYIRISLHFSTLQHKTQIKIKNVKMRKIYFDRGK